MKNEWVIEKIKSLVIVVLFLSAILLLYFFWKGFSLEEIRLPLTNFSTDTIITPNTSELVEPKNVQVTFGPENYTQYSTNTDTLWNNFVKDYIAFSESENIFVEEIPMEKWIESMQMKSIRYEFAYDLPLSYLDALGAASIPQAESIEAFSVIAYSVASRESIFLYDSQNDKYYRMVSDADYTSLEQQISQLNQTPHSIYYPINMFYGVRNDTLLPYDRQERLLTLSSVNEIKDSSKDRERKIAERFFGENLDFIRKIIEDDGTVIYMYGVGQKILTLDPQGIVEYTEEVDNDYRELPYYQSLNLATEFVARHGSWTTIDGKEIDSYLEYSTEINDSSRRKGYRFSFGLKQDGYPLFNDNGPQMIVELIGDQIVYYKRQIDTAYNTMSPETEDRQIYSIIELLPAKYTTLALVLKENGAEISDVSADEQFNSVIEQITALDIGYFKQSDQEGDAFFIPAWVINFSSINIFFDLYSGDYLGFIDEATR